MSGPPVETPSDSEDRPAAVPARLHAALLAAVDLPDAFLAEVEALWAPLAGRIAARRAEMGGTLVVGLCGPQGSGKSTGAAALKVLLEAEGLRTAVLSLDDFYLSRAARAALATVVHPLFATRGPPGTHDVALGLRVLDGLAAPGAVPLPRFDKASDDPLPEAAWPVVDGPVDVVLFEGWCVGARPQRKAALASPVNPLEATEDADGVWRRHVNAALAGPYRVLFQRIGFLIQLRAPSFDAVLGWRREQEHQLRARTGRGMSDAEVARFVQHYERLTRHIDAAMPAYADVVVQLDGARRPRSA